jgi:hypothetical protein
VVASFKSFIERNNMFIENERNRTVLMSEYMLSESIRPTEIEYGTDFYDKQWKKLSDIPFGYVTFFKTKKHNYAVLYIDGFVGFGYIGNDLDSYTTVPSIQFDRNYESMGFYDATYVFNYVFFILTEAIKKFNPSKILFDGYDKRLAATYESMIHNKNFIKELKKYGFVFAGKTDRIDRKFFTFERGSDA